MVDWSMVSNTSFTLSMLHLNLQYCN